MSSAEVDNALLDLHNPSYLTLQPHSLIAKYQPKFGKDPSPFTSEGDAVEQCETVILAFKNSIKSLNLFLFRCLPSLSGLAECIANRLLEAPSSTKILSLETVITKEEM